MTRKFIALLLIITMFLIAGCDPIVSDLPKDNPAESNTNNNAVANPEKNPSEHKTDNFIIYTFADNGTNLNAQNISISELTVFNNVNLLNYLLKNDKIFDKNAKVKSVEMQDNIAKVDFNKEFKNIKVGGSNNELLIVASIVNTLIDNDVHIKKVQFLIEGKPVETLSGHVDISDPIEKISELISK